jgi:dipeptidyl aminopeptidase/acylaminoacyl peptidase
MSAQIDLKYQVPPVEIRQLADAPPPPVVRVDDEGKWMILLHRDPYKTIDEVSAEEYRLAGLRINPKNNASSRIRYYKSISVLNVATGKEQRIKDLPEKALISSIQWSPDFTKLAFTNTLKDGIELWIADVANAQAHLLTAPRLNQAIGRPYIWAPQSDALICKFVLENRGDPKSEKFTPIGPVVQENLGKKAPARTYQDLLGNPQDEYNFDYFTSSEIKSVSLEGKVSHLMDPGIYVSFSFSPDGQYILTSTIHRPYSYLVPYYRFPERTFLVDRSGNFVTELYDAPLEEERPKGFMATSKGPRSFSWRPDKPATVYWVEALDEGDPKLEAENRDAIYTLSAPFTDLPVELVKTPQRFSTIHWNNDETAIIVDYWWNIRNRKIYKFSPGSPATPLELIFDLNTEDLYKDPGYFVTKLNKYNKPALISSSDGKSLYLIGQGYSPEGNKPFVDAFDISSKTTRRLWQADGLNTYEQVIDILDIDNGLLLTRSESPTDYSQSIHRFKRCEKGINPL